LPEKLVPNCAGLSFAFEERRREHSRAINAMNLSGATVGVMESDLELAGVMTRELAVWSYRLDSL
jgi:hypothetical protein